ncbi:MAG: hypothetical protein K9N01_12670 [Cephaloticoccus sp.]|nr:hypothetical protein [Cephaloticoccus sp.]
MLQAVCGVAVAAYQGDAGARTDGVEFAVDRVLVDGSYERLGSLWLDPAGRPVDAGFHVLEARMDFDHETNLVLSSGPGPAQSYSHDWAMFRSVKIN